MPYNQYTISIVNMFLYGSQISPTPPTGFVNDEIIRPENIGNTSIDIDLSWYMSFGPGRFGLAALSPIVKAFFDKDESGAYINDAPAPSDSNGYTKTYISEFYGNMPIQFQLQQYNYTDGADDFGERIFVWNSSAFSLDEGVRFFVDADGTRHVKNMLVAPLQTVVPETPKDNFDFNSDNIAANNRVGNERKIRSIWNW